MNNNTPAGPTGTTSTDNSGTPCRHPAWRGSRILAGFYSFGGFAFVALLLLFATADTASAETDKECDGAHCADIKDAKREGWYPEGVKRYDKASTDALEQTLEKFGKKHKSFDASAAIELSGQLRSVKRNAMAKLLATGLGIRYDKNGNGEDAILKLYDKGITVGFSSTPGTDKIDNFRGGDLMTNGQMASFLNRVEDDITNRRRSSSGTGSPGRFSSYRGSYSSNVRVVVVTPELACVADGVGGHGDAVRVSWSGYSSGSWRIEYDFLAGSTLLNDSGVVELDSSSGDVSFDTAALDAAFGSANRGIRVRASVDGGANWSQWVSQHCGISCAAALNRIAATVHVIAGVADAAEPRLSVGMTQVVEPGRQNSMYLIDTTTGDRVERPSAAECRGYGVDRWHWQFAPAAAFTAWTDFVAGKDGCVSGGSYCVYRVTDAAAVNDTFSVTARPVAHTKLTGRTVYGAASAVDVVTRSIWVP